MPVVCNSQILRQSAMVQSLPAFGRQGLLGHAPALVQRRSAALGGRYQVKVEAAKGKFFVGGNWKCNGTISEVTDLVQQLNKGGAPQDVEVVVAPTFLHLDYVKNNLKSPYQVSQCTLNPLHVFQIIIPSFKIFPGNIWPRIRNSTGSFCKAGFIFDMKMNVYWTSLCLGRMQTVRLQGFCSQ